MGRSNWCAWCLSALVLLAIPAVAQEQGKVVVPVQRSQAAAGAGQRWALLIGINEYWDGNIPDLSYCVNDVQAVYDLLVDPAGGAFPRDNVLLMVSDAAVPSLRPTRNRILAKLANWLPLAGPEDTVLVYFSGHGFEEKGQAYVLPSDASPGILADSAISLNRLHELLGAAGAKQSILILDACHSTAGKAADARMGSRFASSLFADAEGRAVLSSCNLDEQSYEYQEAGHSVFTYFLLRALEGQADSDANGVVTLTECNVYVWENVRRWAGARGLKQTPRMLSNIAGDIQLTAAPPTERAVLPPAVPRAQPAPIRPLTETGMLLVDSNPSRANVYVDDALAGETPLFLEKVGTGRHAVEVRVSGYQIERTEVNIAAGKVSEWDVRLRRTTGVLTVMSEPSGLEVLVDGVRAGTTPLVSEHPLGEHLVVVRQQRVDGCFVGARMTDVSGVAPAVLEFQTEQMLPLTLDYEVRGDVGSKAGAWARDALAASLPAPVFRQASGIPANLFFELRLQHHHYTHGKDGRKLRDGHDQAKVQLTVRDSFGSLIWQSTSRWSDIVTDRLFRAGSDKRDATKAAWPEISRALHSEGVPKIVEWMSLLAADAQAARGSLAKASMDVEALGIRVRTVSRAEREKYGRETGVLIVHGSARQRALRRGDIITRLADEEVEYPARLATLVAKTRPGSEVELRIVRNRREQTVKLTVEERGAQEH